MEPVFVTPTLKQRGIAALKAAIPLAVALFIVPLSRLYTDEVADLSVCEQLPWLRGVVASGVVVLTVLTYLCCRAGLKTWRSGQFPAPGTAVLFKRRVYTGWWARLNAITFFILAAFLVAALAVFLRVFAFSEAGSFIVGLSRCGP